MNLLGCVGVGLLLNSDKNSGRRLPPYCPERPIIEIVAHQRRLLVPAPLSLKRTD
jgi:hypothetical protein